MKFHVFASHMFVGTLRITSNGHHRFRNMHGSVLPADTIKRYKRLNLRRY